LMNESKNNSRELKTIYEKLKSDSSAAVRLSMASTLQKIPAQERWSWIDAFPVLAEDSNDHNLPLMIWYAVEPMADIDRHRALQWAIEAGKQVPILQDFMLRRIAETGGAESINSLVTAMKSATSNELQASLLQALQTVLAGQRSVPMPKDWREVFDKIAKSNQPELLFLASKLGVIFGDSYSIETLRAILKNTNESTEHRAQAIESLSSIKDASIVNDLMGFVDSTKKTSNLTQIALQGLTQYDLPEVGIKILKVYSSLDTDEKKVAMATLCSRSHSAALMLDAIEKKQIPASDLTADLARQIEFLKDDSIIVKLKKNWGEVRSTPAEKLKLIENYKQLVASKTQKAPDEKLGKEIFAKTCQRCHALFGTGQNLGPDLTGSNRANLDYLLENIVDPSAVMANEYRQSILLTNDGRIVTGIVKSENEKTISIQTPEALVTIAKEDIEERKLSEKSMMPDDQLSPFSPHEIRSLFNYLRSTR